jgi:hypothetical protein
MSKVETEEWDCFVCDEPVKVTIMTGPHDTSPDLYMVPAGCWIGLTTVVYEDDEADDDEDADQEFVVCCSSKCCEEMLSDDEAPEVIDTTGEELQ